AKRFFRRTIVLPNYKPIEQARLRVCADDRFTATLNGQSLGSGDDWRYGRQFDDLSRLLKAGTNVISIVAENRPAALPANPAGLIALLEIRFADATVSRVGTDNSWRSATTETKGWDVAGFDDRTWAKALVVGRYGDGPWGRI